MKNIALFLSALGALLFSAAEINAQITPPYYNPANVRITGGTINGTTIGATTPATGAFTTLAAGNTAITGTLSSTGSMSVVPTTGTNPAWLFFKNDSGAANSYIGQDGSVAGLDTAYSLNVWNGSNTPIIFGANNAKVGSWSSTGLAVNGTLSASGLGTFSSGAFTDSGALQIGADIGASSITNATRKFGAITTPHYTNAQEKVVLASVDSNAAATLLNIGGGSSSFNSPTAVDVYAQAAVDTGGGSVVGTFSSTGLAVTGTLSATGTITGTVAATANAFIAAASGGGDLLRIVPNAAGNGVDLLARNSADTILEPLALYGKTVKLHADGGVLIGDITTTGLAVTGTLSSTGQLQNTNGSGNSGQWASITGAGTSISYLRHSNTGGDFSFGVAGSSAALVGGSAYSTFINTNTATNIEFGVNGSLKGTFSSTALTLGTGVNLVASNDVILGKTITTGGTTGNQTINKTTGRVNFAAAATSLVVTNSLVTANSICHVTKATNDATMRLGACVAAAGSITIYADVAPAAETAVNFTITN